MEDIAFRFNYIYKVLTQVMQFWQEKNIEQNNAYNALQKIGNVDINNNNEISEHFMPYLKDDLMFVAPQLKKLGQQMILYSDAYTNIVTERVAHDGTNVETESQKIISPDELFRTTLIMTENLIISLSNMFSKIANLYGYNALLGKTSAIRYHQFYTVVRQYMINNNLDQFCFAIAFDEHGIISIEERIYQLPKLQ